MRRKTGSASEDQRDSNIHEVGSAANVRLQSVNSAVKLKPRKMVKSRRRRALPNLSALPMNHKHASRVWCECRRYRKWKWQRLTICSPSDIRSVLSSQNQVRCLFGDHNRRCVGISAGKAWHYGGVDDA